MAPSSTRTRSPSRRRNSRRRSGRSIESGLRRRDAPRRCGARTPSAWQIAYGQFGAVQRVEVEFLHAVLLQAAHLLDREARPRSCGASRGRHRARRSGARASPARSRRSAARTCSMCGKRVIGRMPGTMSARDAGGRALVAEAQEDVRVEEELRDRAVRAGVDLRAQVVEIELRARCLGMHFRVGGDGDVEVADRTAGRARGRRRRQSRPGAARSALPGWRVAAQRDDVPHARVPVRRAPRRGFRRAGAPMQVRCGAGVSAVSLQDARDDVVRALARRAVGAVGHRNEARRQRREALDRRPERLLPWRHRSAERTRTTPPPARAERARSWTWIMVCSAGADMVEVPSLDPDQAAAATRPFARARRQAGDAARRGRRDAAA